MGKPYDYFNDEVSRLCNKTHIVFLDVGSLYLTFIDDPPDWDVVRKVRKHWWERTWWQRALFLNRWEYEKGCAWEDLPGWVRAVADKAKEAWGLGFDVERMVWRGFANGDGNLLVNAKDCPEHWRDSLFVFRFASDDWFSVEDAMRKAEEEKDG